MTIKEALEVLWKEYNCRTMMYDAYCNGGRNCDPGICKNYVDDEDVTEALKTVLDALGNCSVIPNSSDLVSRSYLLAEYYRQHEGPPGGARKIIAEAPPVQAGSTDNAEFWRKRAKDYENMVINLTEKISKGAELESMEMNAEGLVFKMKEPPVQAGQKITHCENCKHKHLENDVWTCPFGLSGGPEFFCGYGSDDTDD